MRVRAFELDRAYRRHALHHDDHQWVEKNCYVDIWIEVIHALGCEPLAMLPFVVALDFEGDRWTFYKPVHDEVRTLYGIDIQETYCSRPLLEQAAEHLAAGKLISTGADAWWMPDASGTDYRRQHTKSTIVLTDLDADARRLGYFHNAGYYTLDGEDFAQTFAQPLMPFFAELVRVDRKLIRPRPELVAMSGELLRKHDRTPAGGEPDRGVRPALRARPPDAPGARPADLPRVGVRDRAPARLVRGADGVLPALAHRRRRRAVRAGGGRVRRDLDGREVVHPQGRATRALTVPPASALELPAAALFDHFLDLTYAYRFGPPTAHVIHATFGDADAFHFPAGFPARELEVGLSAIATGTTLAVSARRFAQSVSIDVPGYVPSDDGFHLAPGQRRTVELRGSGPLRGHVSALNAEATAKVEVG